MASNTRYAGLGYRMDAPGLWRFVDKGTDASIGPQYPTKAELLSDIENYAKGAGWEPATSRRKPKDVVLEKTLLICAGQFIVLTTKEVQVHLLNDSATARFWDGMEIADTRTFKPDQAREYVIRQTFGQDAVSFLPAHSFEAIFHYAEHYEGALAEQVKGICACILTGTPYGPESHRGSSVDGDGLKVAPVPSPKGSGPTGATFDENDPQLYLKAAKDMLSQVAGKEVDIVFE